MVQIRGVESYEGIMSSYIDTENLSYYDLDLWLNKALSGNNKNVKTEIPKGGIMRLDKWAVTARRLYKQHWYCC